MIERVRQFIAREQLLDKEGCHLVAVSGGADSVCLLLLLLRMGYSVEAVHCNFHLRGEESSRDERFVELLCEKHGVTLHRAHFDTKGYAALHHVSIEMAARELRYRYFEQLRRDIGAQTICVAHHQDDVVETILMNLLRGTGIHGLTGIKPRRGHIVRPLLCVSRGEIENWLSAAGQDYVTDSSNLVADVVRNQLRLNVIPQLRQVTPHATDNILQTARRLADVATIYDKAATAALDSVCRDNRLDVAALLQQPAAETLLYHWLAPAGFTPAAIEAIFEALPQAPSGREWQSATHQLVTHRGSLLLEPLQAERPVLRIPETGTYVYDDATRLRVTTIDGQHIERAPQVCCADTQKLTFPLTVRPVRPGDRFQPLGMKGSRLVSDYLTDRHLSVFDKRRTLVVTDATEAIVWLVGHRPDHRFRVTDHTASTTTITLL